MAFSYQPLDLGAASIRLLRLEPGEWSTEICCELYNASLDTPPPYEALSYVWGSTEDLRQIRLNDHPHYVTSNLEIALRHLRLESQAKTLWVDALCINQESFDEKKAQVQRMSEIYVRAANVISWLGEASDDSNEAMEMIGNIGRWMRDNEDRIFDADENDEELTMTQYLEAKGFPMSTQNWSAFCNLLERPYWTRVWIVQELAVRGHLHQSTGDIFCGSASIKRFEFDLACAAVLLAITGNSIRGDPSGLDVEEPLRSILSRGWPPGLAMIQTLNTCNGREKPTLTSLMGVSRRFEASKRRDKIYALLGLACERDRLLEPDYESPLPVILQDLVEFLVRTSGNLHILLGNRFNLNADGPSWTPDLGSRLRGDVILVIYYHKVFKADYGRPPIVNFDKNLGTMDCRGISLGTVERVIGPYRQGEKLPNGVELQQGLAETLGHRQFIQEISDFSRSSSQDDKNALCRTLVMDYDSSQVGDDDVHPAPDNFVDMMQVIFEGKSPPENFKPGGNRWERMVEYTFPFSKSMENAGSNRCVFVTERGNLGMGPYAMKVGDMIVVLLGSPFCLVLRRTEDSDKYKLVGDAYVHGAMEGEFIKDVEDSDLETFTLH